MEEIVARYEALIHPIIKRHGAQLYEMEAKYIGRTIHLIVRVDKPGRISLAECAQLSEAISYAIDENQADWFNQPFVLQVTSPGAERELCGEEVERAIDEYVHLDYYGHYEGETYHEGYLVAVEDDHYELKINDFGRIKNLSVPINEVRKARLAVKI